MIRIGLHGRVGIEKHTKCEWAILELSTPYGLSDTGLNLVPYVGWEERSIADERWVSRQARCNPETAEQQRRQAGTGSSATNP